MTDEISPAQDAGINQLDYLKLFMQELTYQDPLKPVDNREFMAQMAQFSALQEARTSNDILRTLSGDTHVNECLSFLGKSAKFEGIEGYYPIKVILFSDKAPPKLKVEIHGELVEKEVLDIREILS